MNKPEAIVITYPVHLLKKFGGYKRFLSGILEIPDYGAWLQRCRNKPKHDVLHVYVTVCGRIRFRMNYAGWDQGPTEVKRPDGSLVIVSWPRIVLTGPVVMAPNKIPYKGFQGFRYTDILFF